jgi:hypothetical membrane protein
VVAPAVFVVSFLVQGALRPGYDPLRHPVSSLVLGSPAGWVQIVTFVVTGGLVAAYAGALARSGAGRWTPILLAAVGIGLVGAGIFPTDPINGYPPGAPDPAPRTAAGQLHDLFSTPVFTALPAAALVLGARFSRVDERTWAGYSRLTAALFWVCFGLSSAGFAGVPALVPTGGLWQRLSLVIGLGWLAATALRWWRRTRPGRFR